MHELLLFIVSPKVSRWGGVVLLGQTMHESLLFIVSTKVCRWGGRSLNPDNA